MTGAEIVIALELIRRGVGAVKGISQDLPEALEFIDELSQKIKDEDDDNTIEAKAQEAAKVVTKRKRYNAKSHRRSIK